MRWPAWAAGERPMARFVLGMYEAARDGFFAGVDPQLTTLLGREPQTVRGFLAGQIPSRS